MGHSTRRLMMGAAGAGGDPTYVEDVFSTYLWEGNGVSGRPIENGIKLGNANAGGSVDFKESNVDKLSFASTSDFTFGTGDFTIDFFVFYNAIANDGVFSLSNVAGGITTGSALSMNVINTNGGSHAVYFKNVQNVTAAPGTCNNVQINTGQWYHLAMVRQNGESRFFVDGVAQTFGSDCTNDITITDTTNYTWTDLGLGGYYDNTFLLNGKISNFRITKGQALYWSNFTKPTQALTTTSQGATASNVKLLCCNKGTLTGKTVGPTITSSGAPTASGFGPFTGTDGEGGMTWIRRRNQATDHYLFDTTSGATKYLASNDNMAQQTDTATLTGFNNNGFTLGSNGGVNGNGNDFVGWTWRKQKGFFDIVTWSGNGTAGRTIAHSLGSVPGCIMIKNTNNDQNWQVYHRGIGAGSALFLDLNYAKQTGAQFFNNVEPTSTHFTLGTDCMNNCSGYDYIAYVFAGGPSTAATARSVSCNGSNYLQVASSSDFAYGTGDFTWECWAKSPNNPAERILISNGTDYGYIGIYSQSGRTSVQYVGKGTNPHLMSDGFSVARNQWFHVAVSRNSGVSRLFLNGQLCNTPQTDTSNYPAGVVDIGRSSTSPNNPWQGWISNVRIVKGTGLYTSSFTPSTEPLKNVSGTVLLCCNDSSPTGSTVTPGTITNNNSVTAETDTPFDDPEGYKFGEEGDQNLIKCGNFTTDTTNGSYLDLPWEPQWILYKHDNAAASWHVLDCMRGWTDYGFDSYLFPNSTSAEIAMNGGEELLRNTIRFQGYGNNYDYVYMAIRRPEPLVSKPVEVGNKVLAIVYGAADSATPQFRSPTVDVNDCTLYWQPASGSQRYYSTRLKQAKYWLTNGNQGQTNDNNQMNDYMYGYGSWTSNGTDWLSYAWKRHAGFDVISYVGNDQNNRQIKHSLGRVPEMIWTKNMDLQEDWCVWHYNLDSGGGSQRANYFLRLNSTAAEGYNNAVYGGNPLMLPTSTCWQVGNNDMINNNNNEYISMAFASVEGVCKVGAYDGTGSAGHVITTGFLPRLLLIKTTNASNSWFLYDAVRGLGAGNDPYMQLENTNAQAGGDTFATSSTGFTINQSYSSVNASGQKYIYYAHA